MTECQSCSEKAYVVPRGTSYKGFNKEFDPGSGRTLAARLTHASRTSGEPSGSKLVADG